MRQLIIGEVSSSGNVHIMDEDRLCYLVKNTSKGAQGLRTISKKLLEEFVNYIGKHPDATANEAREELAGNSQIDKFEYGYAATLVTMAKMVIDESTLASPSSKLVELEKNDAPLQQIFYGAPGTGKSHIIKELTKGAEVIRTTFHPDSDYSTFVGAYKPTMGLLPICDELGQPMKIGSTVLHKEQIVYKFVDQAFLQAYVKAWKFYAEANGETPKNQYLIIEEINRGNCAQIFGDLFQLLDRNRNGFSEYPINADNDMKKQLAKAFKGLTIAQTEKINCFYDEENIVKQVLEGDVLLLPDNLYIWATMNTSDQSLFPIDSAFKRRWDWKYMPISDAGKGWVVEAGGFQYSWWEFLTAINELVSSTTSSEDKKLGYFFCKAKDCVIDAESFVGKVVFYLWNDVFKDYGFEGSIFQMTDSSKMTFGKFYKEGNESVINEQTVVQLMKNLKVASKPQFADSEEEEDEEEYGTPRRTRKNSTYLSVNYNGEIIEEKTSKDTFVKTINRIIEQKGNAKDLINMQLQRGNYFIFSEKKIEGDDPKDIGARNSQVLSKSGNCYILTKSSTGNKAWAINAVAQKLGIEGLKAEEKQKLEE